MLGVPSTSLRTGLGARNFLEVILFKIREERIYAINGKISEWGNKRNPKTGEKPCGEKLLSFSSVVTPALTGAAKGFLVQEAK